MGLTAIELTPSIGAELKIDAKSLVEGSYASEIRDLLVRRGVIVVRDIHLSDDQQRTFTRTIGDLRLGTFTKEGEQGNDEGHHGSEAKSGICGLLSWHFFSGTSTEPTRPFRHLLP
jgi:alpha-ketoglutarate-dependent taurine dioxygenase